MTSHHEKYKSMAKRLGIGWPDNKETFLGKTLSQWTKLYKSDNHLNNIPLSMFDANYNPTWYKTDTVLVGYSLSDNTCCYKAVIIAKILGDS